MNTFKEQNEKAHQTLSELCKDPSKFSMRVPPDEERDTDLIISKALVNADTMFELLKECRDCFLMLSLIDKSSLCDHMMAKIEKITLQN